jgi:hypothetical protein
MLVCAADPFFYLLQITGFGSSTLNESQPFILVCLPLVNHDIYAT